MFKFENQRVKFYYAVPYIATKQQDFTILELYCFASTASTISILIFK